MAPTTARPEFGGNVRWGITSNLTLNGTINPDFSQVEGDIGQVASDSRFALSFPERRPFFVEGSEQFTTPNNLVYTRRIGEPVGAVKLTGKLGSTAIGLLSAVDDRRLSGTIARQSALQHCSPATAISAGSPPWA